MTKLPSEIKIGNRTISVKVKKIDDGLMGMYDFNTYEILLNNNLKPAQQIETFWHELIHAIHDYNRVGIELQMELEKESGDASEDAWNFEERMTENFAKVFLQVIQDNKLLNITN